MRSTRAGFESIGTGTVAGTGAGTTLVNNVGELSFDGFASDPPDTVTKFEIEPS